MEAQMLIDNKQEQPKKSYQIKPKRTNLKGVHQ